MGTMTHSGVYIASLPINLAPIILCTCEEIEEDIYQLICCVRYFSLRVVDVKESKCARECKCVTYRPLIPKRTLTCRIANVPVAEISCKRLLCRSGEPTRPDGRP